MELQGFLVGSRATAPALDLATHAVLPENTYCLIFLTFFRSDVNLVSSVIVRIHNHEAHCLRAATACVYRDPVCGELLFRQLRVAGIARGNEIPAEIG